MFKKPKGLGIKKMAVRSDKSKNAPFLKKSKKRQAVVGHTVKGETTMAPYGIGADMSQSKNY